MKFSISLRWPILQVVKKILGEILLNCDMSRLELDQKTFFLSPDHATFYYIMENPAPFSPSLPGNPGTQFPNVGPAREGFKNIPTSFPHHNV